MLKYQKIVLLFTILLISVIIADIRISITVWWYVGIISALSGFLAYGSINIRSGYYCRVLCSSENMKNMIALTFDDGPDKTVTPEILEILKRHNVKAAFFCIGHKALENPDLIMKIDQQDHIVGNHSYSHHFFFDLFSPAKMVSELQKTENILNNIIHKKIMLFRPPYGVTNPPLAKAVKKMDYKIIGWSLRSKDTIISGDKLFDRLTKRLKSGDIIIFHDTNAGTVKILDKFINFAKENNYCFERPDILLGIKPYA